MSFDTPVVFLVFNRPDTTKRVFEVIAKVKPSKLFIVADGPRANHPTDEQNCAQVRSIAEQIDWSCEVYKNYADTNMGCRDRVSSGISWVFTHTEEAIILEDDCLPSASFFYFCRELLHKYRHDSRIMHICGNNLQFNHQRTEYSYYFSRFAHIWGWATWRRAWQYYDVDMKLWNIAKDSGFLENIFNNRDAVRYWFRYFQRLYDKSVNTWDGQWMFSCWIQSGLSIIPSDNLISNIGFGKGATHTLRRNIFAEIPINEVSFPLQHPPFIAPNFNADMFTQNLKYSRNIVAYLKRSFFHLKKT